MPLEMKYFVLKPKSRYKGDLRAKASRMAMYVYASWIRNIDPDVAKELTRWARKEENNDLALIEEKNEKNL